MTDYDSNYDSAGWYCANCDRSYADDDYELVPVGQWGERFRCPHCGITMLTVHKNDTYYELAYYLLSVSDDDGAWPDYALRFEYNS